jgi:hypothetical protein
MFPVSVETENLEIFPQRNGDLFIYITENWGCVNTVTYAL